MTFELTELRSVGIEDRNLKTIHEYEEYLEKILPSSEVIKDMFIEVNLQPLLSDLYFFSEGLLIEIPDFVTYYDGKFYPRKMNFTIHPIKKAIVFLTMKIGEAKGSEPRTVEVNFGLRTGTTFSFAEIKENSLKLEFISKTYLVPNLENG